MSIIATIHVPKDAVASRDPILSWVAKNDPARFRSRVVRPVKGKGAKRRPRNSNRARRAHGE
jgi:hypothetical protein